MGDGSGMEWGLGSTPTGIENIRHQLPPTQLTARTITTVPPHQLLKEVRRQ